MLVCRRGYRTRLRSTQDRRVALAGNVPGTGVGQLAAHGGKEQLLDASAGVSLACRAGFGHAQVGRGAPVSAGAGSARRAVTASVTRTAQGCF